MHDERTYDEPLGFLVHLNPRHAEPEAIGSLATIPREPQGGYTKLVSRPALRPWPVGPSIPAYSLPARAQPVRSLIKIDVVAKSSQELTSCRMISWVEQQRQRERQQLISTVHDLRRRVVDLEDALARSLLTNHSITATRRTLAEFHTSNSGGDSSERRWFCV